MAYEAGFNDPEIKEMQKKLFDAFPVEVQIMALFEMLEGRPETAKAICRYRQELAEQYMKTSLILPSKFTVSGTLSITHPNGAVCTGEDCSTFGCPNRK